MKNIKLDFIKNKFYISGVLTGLLIASAAGILIASYYLPPPEPHQTKGTMSAKCQYASVKSECNKCHDHVGAPPRTGTAARVCPFNYKKFGCLECHDK